MKKIIELKYWLLIVWLSCKWMFRITLGDEVIYKRNKYKVANGDVCNCWRIHDYDQDYYKCYVPQKDCTKVWSLYGMISSFKSGYSFYMTSWYQIWCSEGIQDWMKALPIWAKD